ncbi:hypothetical protein [Sphingopyxis sp. NJF-3]
MSSSIASTAARLQRDVPATEFRIDDALLAVSSLMTTIVTARRDIDNIPAVAGQATIQRLAKAQLALVGVSGDVLRVHGELARIATETAGYDLHECPEAAPSAGLPLRSVA